MKALIDFDVLVYRACFACKDEPLGVVEEKIDEYVNDILKACGTKDFQGYLTGGTCFRREKYPDYKGNRKQEKPEWYKEIRDYLVQEYDAIVTDDGREADDVLVLEQSNNLEETIICSSDKDFNTQEGWKYNPNWDVKYWVSEEDAELWFWCQMVMGDTSDKIKGVKGHGKAWCIKNLDCEDPKLAVIALYRKVYGDDFEEYYNKNYELLRIG